MVLRTPSRIRFTNVGGINIDLYGKTAIGSSETLLTNITGDVVVELVDTLFVRIESTSDFSGVTVDVKWLPQTTTPANGQQVLTVVPSF